MSTQKRKATPAQLIALEKARAARAAKNRPLPKKIVKQFEDEIKAAESKGRPQTKKERIHAARSAAGKKGAEARWKKYREAKILAEQKFSRALVKVERIKPEEIEEVEEVDLREEADDLNMMRTKQLMKYLEDNLKITQKASVCLSDIYKDPRRGMSAERFASCLEIMETGYKRLAETHKLFLSQGKEIGSINREWQKRIGQSIQSLSKTLNDFTNVIVKRFLTKE